MSVEGTIVADRRRMLLQGPIAPALFRLAIPIILGNALQSGYQLTDAFWVGRLGAPAVAAVAVSFPVTFLVIALGAGLAMAGAILSAQYMGAGRQGMVNHVAAQTMLMVAVTSVILGTVGYVVTPYLLMLLGVAPDVYQGALGFMRVSFIGIIFVFLYAMFQALMRGIGETRIPLIIVLGTVVLNFALDPLFIFGWGPVPGQGVMGAALATLVTQALAALIAWSSCCAAATASSCPGAASCQICLISNAPSSSAFPDRSSCRPAGSVSLSCRFSWRASGL
jgi:putative MATE family efflux protein